MSHNQTAIEFDSISKSFSRHTGRALLRHHMTKWFAERREEQRFFALRDVSFRMGKGESLAVIGTNGAGKSTLLSLVAGLSQPDAGELTVNGRVAALLELGSGFHFDLTGSENLSLNASLLGLTRKRTEELYDSIVEFSGIGDFIDEPLRTYSTGMVMRLAFSVAINMDPDLLIVDEVLAVGDAAFQAKCFEKIMDFKRAGKTVLCVSHAAGMVEHLCERAIWLDHGQLMMDGKTRAVVEAYSGRVAVS
jgi:ABC-type polysaccharide/polyol phosphate transport system ATPase subunit